MIFQNDKTQTVINVSTTVYQIPKDCRQPGKRGALQVGGLVGLNFGSRLLEEESVFQTRENSVNQGIKWVNFGFQGVAKRAAILKQRYCIPTGVYEFLSCCEYSSSPIIHTVITISLSTMRALPFLSILFLTCLCKT